VIPLLIKVLQVCYQPFEILNFAPAPYSGNAAVMHAMQYDRCWAVRACEVPILCKGSFGVWQRTFKKVAPTAISENYHSPLSRETVIRINI